MSVFILGAGAIGSLVGHQLALANKVAPTLLLKSEAAVKQFNKLGSSLNLVAHRPQFNVSRKVDIKAQSTRSLKLDAPLKNLVVATKTYATQEAIRPLVKYLDSDSNVLLLQNGMGMVSRLEEEFWPTLHNVPTFYGAVNTHAAVKTNVNTVQHYGIHGSINIARLPLSRGSDVARHGKWSHSDVPPIVQALMDTAALNVTFVSHKRLLLMQMEKLIANACINPLTAALDCLNGDLLYGAKVADVMLRVVKESVECFKMEYGSVLLLPEAGVILNHERLMASVLELCRKTAMNSSSMRQDILSLNPTEIDWINGHIVNLGRKWGIPTPTNRILVNLVKDKLSIERAKENEPFNDVLSRLG